MPVIPDEIRHVIVDRMRNCGSQRKVGLELNICQDNQPSSGRPKKTTERERRNFCRLSMQKPFNYPKQLLSEVHFENNVTEISKKNVILSRFFGRISAIKPL